MMKSPPLTAERLREVLDYNQGTGVFIWKNRPPTNYHIKIWNTKHAGNIAGCKHKNSGEWVIIIDAKVYAARRLAFLYVTGEWPIGRLSFNNDDKANNSWNNICVDSRLQNKEKHDLTAEFLWSIFRYDKETGDLIWKERIDSQSFNTAWAGKVAGCLGDNGYITVSVEERHLLAHRIIWRMMTGEWPKRKIDHWDLNKTNNKWNNLREATDAQNSHNSPIRSDNKSGFKGVSFEKRTKRWTTQITANGKHIWLGRYDTPEEAAYFYNYAAQYYHKEFARVA